MLVTVVAVDDLSTSSHQPPLAAHSILDRAVGVCSNHHPRRMETPRQRRDQTRRMKKRRRRLDSWEKVMDVAGRVRVL